MSWWQRDVLVLLVLGWSNFVPILARLAFGESLACPVDLGRRWPLDGRPVFGPHKTWRGLLLAVLGSSLAGGLTPLGWVVGLWIGLLSMAGDLAASFIKRRLGLKSGDQALALDQGIESLLPLAVLKGRLSLTWAEVSSLVGIFTVLELVLSPILFRMHIRRNPH